MRFVRLPTDKERGGGGGGGDTVVTGGGTTGTASNNSGSSRRSRAYRLEFVFDCDTPCYVQVGLSSVSLLLVVLSSLFFADFLRLFFNIPDPKKVEIEIR